MYTSPSNIMDALIKLLQKNRSGIDALIKAYEPRKVGLSIFKGMRATLKLSDFPSLEIEPTSGSMEWQTTDSQSCTYGLQFTLTLQSNNVDMNAEYVSNLSREIVQIFNDPRNMTLAIPYEKAWDPSSNGLHQSVIQYSRVEGITYNASKDGNIRTAEWEWQGNVLESYPRPWIDPDDDDAPPFIHELPPK